jgi:hypothetical protein
MQGGFLLDVVVAESATVLELFSSEDETLLIWGNSFLVLDLGLDVLNGVGWLNFQSDGLASQSLDKDLHATAETEDQMQGGFLLDVVVAESATVLELLAGEDETLLIWGNSFLVLDLGLDVLNGVGWLNFQSDGLASQSLDENLHSKIDRNKIVSSFYFTAALMRFGQRVTSNYFSTATFHN